MHWQKCKNILCIRADNMGDVIMSTPAFRALKKTFNCRLTLLTSIMGSVITPYVSEIDETIIDDLPWIKTSCSTNNEKCLELVEKLKTFHFDGAIIFTVYSQSALPSALIAYMANIPLRLAYCRENPYTLLTNWIPDKEPYEFIQHQVKRDISLVSAIGAGIDDEHLSISFKEHAFNTAIQKLKSTGFDAGKKWIIAHAGVSETKREYPQALWVEALNLIQEQNNIQVLLTGTKTEQLLIEGIRQSTHKHIFSAAGILNIEEFIAIVAHSEIVISVNTSTLHIAAALQKPVIALYAQTNPQHVPWQTKNIVLPFSIHKDLKSKNQVIDFVNQFYFKNEIDYPSAFAIAEHAASMIKEIDVIHSLN